MLQSKPEKALEVLVKVNGKEEAHLILAEIKIQ